MSSEAVREFLERVTSDEQLQGELTEAITASAEGSGGVTDREAATDIGKKYGYDFTSDELWAEIQKRQEELQQKTGELSEEELEAVAGGFFVPGIPGFPIPGFPRPGFPLPRPNW